MIDDLLDLTRIARGKIELDKRPVELSSVIARAVEVCRPDIELKQLRFDMGLCADARQVVEVDIARIQQVFWNLIKNAIKFTPSGGQVSLRCGTSGRGRVMAEVTDSGVGIEPEALTRIFDGLPRPIAPSPDSSGGWVSAWPSASRWWNCTGEQSSRTAKGKEKAQPSG